MSKPICNRDEFRARFTAVMRAAGPQYGAPDEMQAYADSVWESYWDDQGQEGETPEDCADSDLSEWSDE